MSNKTVEDDLRDNICRLKLQLLNERMLRNQIHDPQDLELPHSSQTVVPFVNQRDFHRDMKINQMDMELQEARRKYEKLKTKLQHQEIERNISSSVMRSNRAPEGPQTDKFSHFMEMMMLQQAQTQNMWMNQMMMKNMQSKEQFVPYHYIHQPQPYPQPPPVIYPSTNQINKIHKNTQPYPGNEAQKTMRRMGLAALFCSILDCDFQERFLSLPDRFLFEVKIKEIITCIERQYLNSNGDIYKLLNTVTTNQSPNFKCLLLRSGANDELVLAEKEINVVLQNLVAKITEIMPSYGTIGCDCKSILSEFLQNNQTFPERYFFSHERDFLQVDPNNVIHNVGFTESQLLLIGIFFVRSLVMHVMMKSVEYNLCSKLTETGRENLRIMASVIMVVYRTILEEFLSQKYPNSRKTITEFVELESSLLNTIELQPLLKVLKKTMDFAKASILNWSQAYVMKLRPM